jgi:uncharacterized protein
MAILLAWNAALWGVLGALFAPLVAGGWHTLLALAFLFALPMLVLVRAFAGDLYPSAFTRLFVLRPFWYAQLLLPLLTAAGLLGMLVGLTFGAPLPGGRMTSAAVGMVLLVAIAWGYLDTRRLVVRDLELSFPGLPEGFDGMRIVQLSDLHVGPHTSRRHLSRIARAVHAAGPDLIVLTGDQVDDFAGDVEPLGRAFAGLSAPLGVVAVAGNHDVYAGWAAVRRGMEAFGWRVLVNEAVALERGGDRLWLAGTGDPAGHGGPTGADASVVPDILRTLGAVPDGAFTLALAHNPLLWPELAARGVDLTLSGHTHSGQLAIPVLGWSLASAFLEHATGMYRRRESVLYVNPGSNYWGVPFRLGTPPEVTVVTLRSRSL